MKKVFTLYCVFLSASSFAQNIQNNPESNHGNKFEQLGTILPTPNNYRAASGAPGNQYWQQKADYEIDAFLNEKELRLEGSEQITYFNNSPDALSYLWLQLDENQHNPNNEANYFDGSKVMQPVTDVQLEALDVKKQLKDGGVNIISVTDAAGKSLPYTINLTMMRIDLPAPLKPNTQFIFKIKWNYNIPERMKIGGRGGYEFFEGDGNSLFTMSQWYPRMCVYNDYGGWNNKQFTGRGEFALAFGNFKVKMKVPADHVVASTGVCTNTSEMLSPAQQAKWQQAQSSAQPIEIVTLAEAKAKEAAPDKINFKTWNFTAENVRDFAWGSSRKFVWDAMGIKQGGKTVMCMSYYAKEAYGLYSKYSTKAVAHTIKTYSKYTIDYPYPTAISVEAANGMEYPMICFNFGRTEEDGSYTEKTKYGMLGVIIHEVGHNFFPMIINSDERQWSWMDEGLNTFVQFLTEQEFDNNYPSARGPAHKIVDYMKLSKDQLEPIMTNSENINNFGANAYGKPCTALNILRETVMGRERFDFAFKTYAQRWAFKHPTPADFYRTMEDASGVDLDWFWRGWFYDTDPVDISIDSVRSFTVKGVEEVDKKKVTVTVNKPAKEFVHISRKRNKEAGMKFLVDTDTTLRDFYYYNTPDTREYPIKLNRDENDKLSVLEGNDLKKYESNFYYELTFSNKGGTVMPIIIQWNYTDGTSETEKINAYIWRKDENKVTKAFVKFKEVASIQLDPMRETADINEANNSWPKAEIKSRFDIYKSKRTGRFDNNDINFMQKGKK
ncbi:MAG: M1 family metallopeptidase [Bacteroidota bacterium]|nr:M1 family metallopeptidase [Bacteroidota bacterium]